MSDESGDEKPKHLKVYNSPTFKERLSSVRDKFYKFQDKMETRRQESALKSEQQLERKISQSKLRNKGLLRQRKYQRLEQKNERIRKKLTGSSGMSGSSVFGDSLFPKQSKGSDMFGGNLFGSNMFGNSHSSDSIFGGGSLFGEKERRRKKFYRHKHKRK